MLETLETFIKDVNKMYEKMVNFLLNMSSKINIKLARDISLSLQTKRKYIEKVYVLNVRTIDKIFQNLNGEFPFNRRYIKRDVLFWNISFEEIIEKNFN